ncbi:MAG: hypothetical protein GEU28_13065 [Dehalococcoidia bacterium]|nr:hypothetical protein [Dehalococcoidia bacterium]
MPPAEAATILDHTRSCADCSRALTEYSEVVSAMAEALPAAQPRRGLGPRVLGAINEDGESRPRPVADARPRRGEQQRGRLSMLTGLAAAAVVAAVAVLGYTALDARSDADDARSQLSRLGEDVAGGTVLTMEGNEIAPSASITVVVSPDRERATVLTEGLPPSSDQIYHLWLFHDEIPTRAGTFEVERGQVSRLDLEGDVLGASAIAITLEAEETEAPNGPVLVEGTVDATTVPADPDPSA